MNTVDDRDSIAFLDLSYLTDKLRSIAGKVLPKDRYGIMTQQSIVDRLGSQERAAKECKEATCLAELGRKISADYIAQGHVGRFSGELTIKVELYNVGSSNLIGSFAGDSKDLKGLLSVLEQEAPKMFEEMLRIKVPPPTKAAPPAKSADNFGVLEVKPAYVDGIGSNSKWNMMVNGRSYALGSHRFSPGNYPVMLSHECYENIDFNASISAGSREIFDMAGHVKLKMGYLVLNAERGGEPVNGELVYVNSNLVGNTPFNSTVPLCSKIEIGDKAVNVKLKYNGRVIYTYKMPGPPPTESVTGDLKDAVDVELGYKAPKRIDPQVDTEEYQPSNNSFWIALLLDVVGAGFIFYGYVKDKDAASSLDWYNSLGRNAARSEFNEAWQEFEDNKTARNASYILGSAFLATGIGVHIWF